MAKDLKTSIALAVALLGLVGAAPALGGAAEQALLASYVGNWRGESVLQGGDAPEPFRCRLAVSPGNQGKINYTGRCSLVDANLSISGTIAFNDAANQYEAAMSSNAGFTGLAVGRRSGETISFDLRERRQDRAGDDVRIGSRILLAGGHITVDFEVEFNDSGQILTASVPFDR